MTDTFGKRLKAVLEERGKKPKQLAEYVGVSRMAAHNWLNDTNVPELDNGRKIAEFLKVSIAYLYDGQDVGGVRITPDTESRQIPKISLDRLQGCRLDELMSHIQRAEEQTTAHYEASQQAFAVELRDQSNFPEFGFGDIVTVDPAKTVRPGDFVLAIVAPSQYIVRRYREHETSFSLEPFNPNWPTLTSTANDLTIVGPVTQHIRSMRSNP